VKRLNRKMRYNVDIQITDRQNNWTFFYA
jgi:hypothetical protein